MKTQNNISAFTIVELIVVITILAILATVWFVSFQWYWVSSRDSVRLADMRSIEKWFSIKLTRGEQLPIPDDKIDITASGTLLTYQGYAGTELAWNIWVHWAVTDPIDGTHYTYSTNLARNKYQLLGFFESEEFAFWWNKIYANLENRFPKVKWDNLGIILNPISKEPIQTENNNIDIVNTSNEYLVTISEDLNIIWTGSTLKNISNIHEYWLHKNCKDLLNNFTDAKNKNGIYTIQLQKNSLTKVECDMTTNGWWRLKIDTIIPTLEDLYEWMLTDPDTKNLTWNDRIWESGDAYPKYLVTLNPSISTNVSEKMKLNSLKSLIYYRYSTDINFSEYVDGPIDNLYRKVLFKWSHSWNTKIRSETWAWNFYYVNTQYVLIR
jgi:hypothetical protein